MDSIKISSNEEIYAKDNAGSSSDMDNNDKKQGATLHLNIYSNILTCSSGELAQLLKYTLSTTKKQITWNSTIKMYTPPTLSPTPNMTPMWMKSCQVH